MTGASTERGDAARPIARGLIALGIEPGDRVAILSSRRPERTLVGLGALSAGAVVVAIDHTASPDECRDVLRDSGARALICEDVVQLEKISRIEVDCPDLHNIVAFDGAHGRAPSLAGLRAGGITVAEHAPDRIVAAARPDDPALIVYTSDFTGRQQRERCVLTHADLSTSSSWPL